MTGLTEWQREDFVYAIEKATLKDKTRKLRTGKAKLSGYFKLGSNTITFLDNGDGKVFMRVGGGVHPVDFNLNSSSLKKQLALTLMKSLGYSICKRKYGYEFYVGKK